MQHGVKLASAARYALPLAAAAVLGFAPVGPPAGQAAGDPPQHLLHKAPLNGSATPNAAAKRLAAATSKPRARSKPVSQALPTDGRRHGQSEKAVIALLISGLIAAALLFAEARWVPLRRRLHRPLRRLRGAARRPSKTSAAPALAFAGAAQPPDAARPAERQSPGVRHAAHLTPSRPKKAATGTVPSDKNPVDSAGAEDPAMVADRAASYSLAPPKSAPAPAAEDEPAAEELDRTGAPTGTTTLDTLCARIESEITRARDKHLALSIIAMHLYPTSDAAPDLSGVDEAVGRTARKLLGHGAEVVVVESEDDTVWLILPGVLTKRSQAVAEQLRKVIVPYEHRPAVAAVGFPTDGKTAAELVRRCLDRTTRASISREEVAPA